MLPADAPSRPDLHLLLIPVSLVSGALAALVSPLSLLAGVAAGSLVAGLAVVDGLAINPPTRE